jgi:hypothetical protein
MLARLIVVTTAARPASRPLTLWRTMTDQSSSPGRPDDWTRGGYVPGEQYYSEQNYGEQNYGAGAGSSRPGPGAAGAARPGAPGTGMPGPVVGGPGAGPGMPTTPIWQPNPQQGSPGQGGPGQGAPARGGPQQGAFQPGVYPQGASQQGMFDQGASQQSVLDQGASQRGAESKGFFRALFDFSFTSFVTTKIIKVLYVLILVLAVVSALVYTIIAFRVSAGFGILTLVIGDPLFIIIVMAFWRLVLEAFIVVFRISEDIRALREYNDR